MFEKLSDNLNLLMAKFRINASELARATGLPATTINKVRNFDNPNPTLATLLKIAQHFSLTLSQLVGDELLPTETGTSKFRSHNQIPLLTWQAAINWPIKQSNEVLEIVTIEYPAHNENLFALKIESEDLELIAKDTILIIDPATSLEHRDLVIVYKQGHELPSLKQILFDEDEKYLRPLVKGYNLTTLTPQHKLIGVVVEYRKYTKSIRKE